MTFLLKYKWWIVVSGGLFVLAIALFVLMGWKSSVSVTAVSLALATGAMYDEKIADQEKRAREGEKKFMQDLKKRSIRIEQDRKKEIKRIIEKPDLQDQKDDLMEDIDDV